MMKFFFRGKNPPSYVLLIFLLSYGFITAQEITIDGIVSFDGVPLPGVAILNKNTSVGAISDFDGKYSISGTAGNKIEFSYTGFKKETYTLKSNDKIVNILMKEDTQNLQEVVVIGYGTAKKEELTGAVTVLKEEDINKVNAITAEQVLQAKSPGVQVVASEGGPGSGIKVRVRGATSLLASADPLYVIDDVPIITDEGDGVGFQDNGGAAGQSQSFNSPLSSIDPATIESITVLKDASATAIYGTRGANGVVIITTKGGKAQKPQLSFETVVGIDRVARHLDLLSPQEYVNYVNDAFPQIRAGGDNNSIPFQSRFYRDNAGNIIRYDDPRVTTRDWRDEVFRDAILNKHTLSLRGGTKDLRFSGNYSFTDQEGVVRTSDFKRHALNFRINSKINDKLKANFNMNAGYIERNGPATSNINGSLASQSSGVINQVAIARPVFQRIDNTRAQDEELNGIVRDANGDILQIGQRFISNPVRQLEGNLNRSRSVNARFNTELIYEIIPRLKASARLSGTFNVSNSKQYFNRDFGFAQQFNGRAFRRSRESYSLINEYKLQYDWKLGKSKFIHELGGNLWFNRAESDFVEVNEFKSNAANVDNLGLGSPANAGSNIVESNLQSAYFRTRYDYAKRYFLNATLRTDKSSRFLPGSQVGYFYAFGGRWSVSKEKFFKPLKPTWATLDLTASYGVTGNDRIPFGAARAAGTDTFAEGGSQIRINNQDLTWESTESIDYGVQLGFFNRRINIEANRFQKTTTDLLYFQPIPATFGLFTNVARLGEIPAVYTNLGEVSNKGYEFSLNADIIRNKNFSWNTNFNITFAKNRIVDLGRTGDITYDAPFEKRVVRDLVVSKGEEIGTYQGYKTDGVYQFEDFVEFDGLTEDEAIQLYLNGSAQKDGETASVYSTRITETRLNRGASNLNTFTLKEGVVKIDGITNYRPGQRKLKDIDGDGRVNEQNDKVIIARTQPDHFGGFTNTFKIKNFDFSFLLNWSYGNDIYNKNRFRLLETSIANVNNNKLDGILDYWTPYNRDTTTPALRGQEATRGGGRSIAEDTLVEDGTYLRLANISVGYNFDAKTVKNLGLKQLRIYGAVDNIHVWSDYSGYDPDVSVGNTPIAPGIDFDAYPRARSFRFGVKGTF